MTTKAHRKQVTRTLVRLAAQARLNAGDCELAGRHGEALAWAEVALWLARHLKAYHAGQPLLSPQELPFPPSDI